MAYATDVIIPVCDALEHVQECVRSLVLHTGGARLIIVNDGSGETCSAWLRELASTTANVLLVEHRANHGYTRAANSGLRQSEAANLVLLNSDTVVTPGWLEGLLRCADSSPAIGLVGPLSNAASWQSVPQVTGSDGSFAVNAIPDGLSIEDMAALVRKGSHRRYPRTPFLNGFCTLIKRSVIDHVGLLDEASFPVGYGEENDYCLRAAGAGFELAIADDVYVYHAKSKSFGDERRGELSKLGQVALARKHGERKVQALVAQVRGLQALEAARSAVRRSLEQHRRATAPVELTSLKVLFLLPVRGGGGGAHSVIQEAAAMSRLGAQARVAVRREHHASLLEAYRDIPQIGGLLLAMTDDDALDVARGFDVAVATFHASVDLLERICVAYPEILPAYYVQDYEPLFFDKGSAGWQEARDSYTRIPGALLFAKTDWLVRQIASEHDLTVQRVLPSLDHALHYPGALVQRAAVRVTAMVRPQTPRRGAARTMRVLREIQRSAGHKVDIHIFGCRGSHVRFQQLAQDFPFTNHGVLSRGAVAVLLRESHVFVDLSDYQAFGRTGLEAMACGCAAVVPKRGGTDEYAVDGVNALLVDSADERECVARIASLVEDEQTIQQLREEGLRTAARYSLEAAAQSELGVMAPAVEAHRRSNPEPPRRRLVLLPQGRPGKDIAPGGYVRVVHPWRSARLQRTWLAQISSDLELPDPGSADVALLQVDSKWADAALIASWLVEWRRSGAKLLFEVTAEVGAPPARLRARSRRQRESLEQIAVMADGLIVASQHQRSAFAELNPNVFVVPSYLDPTTWRLRAATAPRTPSSGPVRIGMIRRPGDAESIALIAEGLRRIEIEYGNRVRVESVGRLAKAGPTVGTRIPLPWRCNYAEYVDWLHGEARWDIGLLPVAREDDHCESLFFQYAALGMAVIASSCAALDRLIVHDQNALLVSNEQSAWYEAIRQLIDRTERRHDLARIARSSAVNRYDVEANTDLYLQTLEATLSLPERMDAPLAPRRLVDLSWQRFWRRRRMRKGLDTSVAVRLARKLDSKGRLANSSVGRKIRKLVRDPDSFLGDSKHPMLQKVGALLRRRR